MLTLYLSNKSAQVIEGSTKGNKVAVSAFYETLLPEGCFINGTVTDEEIFLGHLKKFWDDNHLPKKNISLIINSTQFVTKIVEAPVMKRKQLLTFIEREFQDVERAEEPVYSYFLIDENKKTKLNQLFAVMVEKRYINDMVELMAKIELELSNVVPSLGCAIQMLQKLPSIKNKTMVVQIIEDVNLTNILFVDGIYTYSNRSRLFSEHMTPSFGVEIARSVSNIEQFMKAQEIEEKMTDILICGLDEMDLQYASESIYQMNADINVKEIDGKGVVSIAGAGSRNVFSKMLIPIGNLYFKVTKYSILQQAKTKKKRTEDQIDMMKILKPSISIGSVLLVITLGFLAYYLVLRFQYNSVNDFNTRPDVISNCEKYDNLSTENAILAKKNADLQNNSEALDSYPTMNSSILSVLDKCANGLAEYTFTSFDAASGSISVNTTADKVEQINTYISRLRQESTFASVDYTGYSFIEEQNKWNVNVTCVLNASAGRIKKGE